MKTLIIDANYFGYRSHYSRGEAKLVFDDERTDVVFGFLADMKTLGARFKSNQFVFCWDSKISKRKEIYPEYKDRRKDFTEAQIEDLRKTYTQFDLLRSEVLPRLGFMTQVQVDGYEADDHIAQCVIEHRNLDSIICSTDHDLYQLLNYSPIYNPAAESMYTIDSFTEEFKLTTDQWPVVKAVAGCTSDNIKGLMNVGEMGVAAYLRGVLKPTTKKYKIIVDGIDAVKEQNLPLVTLPFPGTPSIKLVRNKSPQEAYEGFIEVCRKYGFNSFLRADNLYLWKNFLYGYGFLKDLEITKKISRNRRRDYNRNL